MDILRGIALNMQIALGIMIIILKNIQSVLKQMCKMMQKDINFKSLKIYIVQKS